MRVIDRARIALGVGSLGILLFVVGCDGAGDGGASSVAPPTPPPGQSGADQAAARAKAYPTGKVAAPKPEAAAKPEAASK
jgi:hypothetical protein